MEWKAESERKRKAGVAGEDSAADHVVALGWRVLARNVQYRVGELDLVALGEGVLVFVEVRTRRRGAVVQAADTVTRPKQRRLVRAATMYMQSRPWCRGVRARFDVIAVEAGTWRVVAHHRGAFDVPADAACF